MLSLLYSEADAKLPFDLIPDPIAPASLGFVELFVGSGKQCIGGFAHRVLGLGKFRGASVSSRY